MSRVVVFFIFLTFTIPTMADGGAVIDRYTGEDAWFWFDGNQTVAMFSSDSEFYCDPESETNPYEIMDVIRPDGTIKTHSRASFFIRVFYGVTADDFWADACNLWDNGPIVAEGIVQSAVYNDNDWNWEHPNRRYVWGFNMSGTLYDLTGNCQSGMVDFNLVRKWQWRNNCETGCFVRRAIKGPRLECVD